MKKNFKFMLVALLAMIGSAVYAAAPAVGGTWTDDSFSYEIASVDLIAKTGTIKIAPNGTLSGEITIPGSVVKKYDDDNYTFTINQIADNAFEGQVSITKVTFPVEMMVIGQEAFKGCTLLSEIEFPTGSKLATLGSMAFAETQIVNPDFSNCEKLTGLPDYLFTLGDGKTNSYVKTVTLPTTATFKTIETSLAGLTNLESTNIADTKITIIKEKAFNLTSSAINAVDATKGIIALETPATVKTIEAAAFQGSLIADLTINVDAISDDETIAIGDDSDPIYGTSVAVLKTLTLQGQLVGKVSGSAFAGNTALTSVDMSAMTFASKGQIMTNAFQGCTGLTEVTVGDINHNGTTGEYTINDNAFQGCTALATVTIGDIDTQGAVGATAFGSDLLTLTIGDVKKVNAFAANAFVFKTDAATPVLVKSVTIGDVFNESPDGINYVFPAGTIDLKTAATSTVTIGAVQSKGGVFEDGAITGTVTALTFDGDIMEKGLTDGAGTMIMMLDDNSKVATLTFNGKIGEAGIGDFTGLKDGANVYFKGELAEGSIVDQSFTITTVGTTKLNVEYSATPEDATYNPFSQIAFAGTALNTLPTGVTSDAQRTVTLKITGSDELKELIKAGQISYADPAAANDLIYVVKLLAEEEALTVDVYQVGSTNVAYGRFTLDKNGYFKVERRPQDANITYTLYTTYLEEDEYTADATGKSGLTTLNMLPMVSLDGYYYIDCTAFTPALTNDLVVIVKATGSGVTEDLKMEYEVLDAAPAFNSALYTDERVIVAENILTNKMLRDDDPLAVTASTNWTQAQLGANDIWAISNPKGHNGISADILDYKNSTKPFVNAGMFVALAKHWDNVKAARMIIKWLDESDATGIVEAKTNVQAADNDVIYNLQGVRVSNPTKAGIYVKNGKKFIVK